MSACRLNWQKPTKLLSHSALRRSNTTALQQLPVGDHGGRINTQIKGSAVGVRRLSAMLKKWEALRPHTSARPSSLSNASGEKEGNLQTGFYVKEFLFSMNGIRKLSRVELTSFIVQISNPKLHSSFKIPFLGSPGGRERSKTHFQVKPI